MAAKVIDSPLVATIVNFCVGLAALHVARKDPRGVIVMLPADHHIARPEAFREAIAEGAPLPPPIVSR